MGHRLPKAGPLNPQMTPSNYVNMPPPDPLVIPKESPSNPSFKPSDEPKEQYTTTISSREQLELHEMQFLGPYLHSLLIVCMLSSNSCGWGAHSILGLK